MKKFLVLTAVIGLCLASSSTAQLRSGAVGLGASFAGSSPMAHVEIAASNNLGIMLMLGYSSTSVDNPDPIADPDATSTLSLGALGRYFLRSGDVSPYIGVEVMYMTPDENDKTISFSLLFGAQAEITKNVGIFSHVGFGMDMNTKTVSDKDFKTTTMGIGTAAVGAIFYF